MSKKDDDQATRVDLGEDLIASARVTPQAKPVLAKASVDPWSDQMESAKILASEGLLEEAKRVLRKILIANPGYAAARKKLEELQDAELKQLISESEQPRHRFQVRPFDEEDSSLSSKDPREVEMQMDQDLELGLYAFSPETGETPEDLWFGSIESLREFLQQIERDRPDASAQDDLDLGIGFLEMGLPVVAGYFFSRAAQDDQKEVSAKALLANALIQAGRPLEAANELDSLLRNPEIEIDHKVELSYWMGRAQEALKRKKSALSWYDAVLRLDPVYRDCADRKASLEKK